MNLQSLPEIREKIDELLNEEDKVSRLSPVTFSLPKKLYTLLSLTSQLLGESRSKIVRRALNEYFKRLYNKSV